MSVDMGSVTYSLDKILQIPFVPFMIEEGLNSWGGQRLNDKAKLKQMYGHQMYFTANLSCPPETSEEEIDKIVDEFIHGIGEDNRVLVEAMGPPSLKEKLDRLVAEGKAIL